MSQVKPKPFDPEMLAELETYVRIVMQREEVPGAAMAIVQDGSVVYQQGFGVRDLDKPDPVTAETLMLIGWTPDSDHAMQRVPPSLDGLEGSRISKKRKDAQ